ncbi:MBL fold metallo-hydrolase [Sulfobacillus harzensis]|uniref:MBL fold metallo-hydrolase n=1 Tax=Sulfobacillus harzensis TaxID=2729629 RepID=A0A7Y0L3W0_9FIRM|nr:MBL fold metallo-hydrolase [Sulfobacillus harzensis]NMP21930.1 MBL fold metallo-hydrolase [Sulfobacillus harzensis]
MIWQTLQNPELGCNSYLIGDEVTGQGLVVDPLEALGVDHYVLSAQDLGIDIQMVVETHVHADHASCASELAKALGVPHGISHAAPATFPHQDLKDQEVLKFGMLSVEVWETPGHTPDSISLIIRDLRRGTVPWAVLTGDSLFVGDVGRPDLADANEEAVLEAAKKQHASVHRLMGLPDGVELWPAHYGSSPCGGIFMNKSPHSTIGYEREANPFLTMDLDTFVDQTLRLLKPPPEDAAKLREQNLAGIS